MRKEPIIAVGIMDRQTRLEGRLHGDFSIEGVGPVAAGFSASVEGGNVVLFDAAGREVRRSDYLHIQGGPESVFELFGVMIGSRFHWERAENQTFRGDLLLRVRQDGTFAVINDIPLEAYLESVISSEMNAAAPVELLKSHAILSRSWLLAALRKKQAPHKSAGVRAIETEGEVVRWYDREDHDLFDVCADDHCQRYHGVTRIASPEVSRAVKETRGVALTWGDEICDARYSKACGGRTEVFETAWDEEPRPYLTSIADAPVSYSPADEEKDVTRRWRLWERDAYCNTKDEQTLEKILPAFDRETDSFFRWTVEYSRRELEEILGEKSGFDFGNLQSFEPLERGPSGRIRRLRVVGSKLSMIVGKELEIRRWLSRSHLYSSAFVVRTTGGVTAPDRFIFHGAGWGHGVGLCQIGAAVMASRSIPSPQILGHYFPGAALTRLY